MKKIQVCSEDTIGVDDQTNLTRPKLGKIRRKQVHEELYEQFDVDTDNIEHKTQKTISREWQKEIIELNVAQVSKQHPGLMPDHTQFTSNVYVIIFDDSNKTKDFQDKFNMNLFRAINTVIESKGESPRNYNRTLVMEVNDNKHRLEITVT